MERDVGQGLHCLSSATEARRLAGVTALSGTLWSVTAGFCDTVLSSQQGEATARRCDTVTDRRQAWRESDIWSGRHGTYGRTSGNCPRSVCSAIVHPRSRVRVIYLTHVYFVSVSVCVDTKQVYI